MAIKVEVSAARDVIGFRVGMKASEDSGILRRVRLVFDGRTVIDDNIEAVAYENSLGQQGSYPSPVTHEVVGTAWNDKGEYWSAVKKWKD